MNGVEAVTIIEPGSTTDARGNVVADWSDDAVHTTTVADALWAPGRQLGEAEDRTLGREGVVAAGFLYLRPGVAIEATWRVLLRGLVFEVDGEPGAWDGAGLEVRLRRVEG